MMAYVAGWLTRFMPWIVITLAVLMGAQYLVLVDREQAQSQCQAEYNAAFTANLLIRSKLSQQSDDAKNDLILGVGKLVVTPPPTTPAARERLGRVYRQLFVTFASRVDEIERARAANPLPPFPDC